MRLERRNLRDTQDPFSIPEDIFVNYYRLPKTEANNLIQILQNHVRQPGNTNAIPFHFKVSCFLLHNVNFLCKNINNIL